ncbi:MAG TPA: hypothetical protein VFT50_16655 [Baekduia sp.]|nr:hypothetical protein [Baekduia sp.]
MLVIASLDTYMHERGVELLDAHAQKGNPEAAATASYLGATAGRVVGPSAKATIRYKLSYKTLASPRSIDQLLTAVGLVATDVWEEMAIAAGSRPDRLRNQIGLHYDRRNQIAHEGDWDHVALDFRPLEDANVADCLAHVRALVNAFDSVV